MTILTWTQRAIADVLSIHAHIAAHSEHYADTVYRRIQLRARGLVDHPRLGSLVPEIERDDIREVFVHAFRVIYRQLPSEVRIITVIHGARRLSLDEAELGE